MREWSIADHFAATLSELNKAKDSYDNEDPLRYPISQMVPQADAYLIRALQINTLQKLI